MSNGLFIAGTYPAKRQITEENYHEGDRGNGPDCGNGRDGAGGAAHVKAVGITLYTVQVNTYGDPTSTLLQNCASDSSKFFLLTSPSQIVTTFQQIGTALSNLRVAK